tara:strand:+ start:472 stop:1647 length:1176 start_codon:yes stop_codon:yes gene_type:complete
MVMSNEQMEADYNSEVGLFSLLRAGGDMVFGEDLMERLPQISRAIENANKLGRGNTVNLDFEETDLVGMDEPYESSSMSMRLSNAPGLEEQVESMGVSPEAAGLGSLALGMVGGPGKKGEGIKSFIELLKSMNIKPNQSILDEAKGLKDLSDDYLKNQGKRNTEKDIDQTRYSQGTVPDNLDRDGKPYPEGHPFTDWDKSKAQIDAERTAKEGKGLLSDLEDQQKEMPPILGGSKKTDSIMQYASRQERRDALGEEGMGRIQSLISQRRSKMAQLYGGERDKGLGFKKEQQLLDEISELERKIDPYYSPNELRELDYFAEGGSVRRAEGGGLYANIHAKRNRIEAGSGERMRSKGESGAPTAATFARAAKTAQRGTGGLAYKKGYYGKSYK